jgi:hypothetical protein
MKAYLAAGGEYSGFNKFKSEVVGFALDAISGNAPREDIGDITTELLDAAIALTHPDRHPTERKAQAQRVTQELLALRPFVFPAPPSPPPKPDGSVSSVSADLIKPSEPKYPCEECQYTDPEFYCDVCKATWEKDQQKKRERKEKKRVEKNARQRERYASGKRWRRPTKHVCASCSDEFESKRADARYCCAACRQRAYEKRDGKLSNVKPVGTAHIERAIEAAFLADPDNAFTTDDLCDHAYPGLNRTERKHRAVVVLAAKTVCKRLGANWLSNRGEMRGGAMVFWNCLSVMSYAMFRLKSDFIEGYRRSVRSWRCTCTEEDLRKELAPGGIYHKYIVEGGAWWQHTQNKIAKLNMTDKQSRSESDLNNRHKAA